MYSCKVSGSCGENGDKVLLHSSSSFIFHPSSVASFLTNVGRVKVL